MKKFKILNEGKIPKKISFVVWDVEGTCSEKDIPNPEVIDWICKLASKGVVSLFVTGRDQHWLKKYLISAIEKTSKKDFVKIAKNLFFRGEVGLIEINDAVSKKSKISPLVKNHPFLNPKTRERVANLFYKTPKLTSYKKGMKVPPGFEIGGDADRNLFLFPIIPPKEVIFPDFVWNEYKEVMGSAEVRREVDYSISPERLRKILPMAKEIEKVFKKWGYLRFVKTSPTTTSINLPIKLAGDPIDKNWAVGRALIYFSQKLKVSIGEIATKTIAIGDALVDFLFSTPKIERENISIPFIFVGPKSQYKPNPKQKKNVIINSISPHLGTKVVLEVLDYLKDRFKGL